jgi:hypothetical protein
MTARDRIAMGLNALAIAQYALVDGVELAQRDRQDLLADRLRDVSRRLCDLRDDLKAYQEYGRHD